MGRCMRNFTVSTTFDGKWWVFIIHELGCVGQMRYRREVQGEARLLAAVWLDVQPNEINIGQVRYMHAHWTQVLS
jgi:hypothetical protein